MGANVLAVLDRIGRGSGSPSRRLCNWTALNGCWTLAGEPDERDCLLPENPRLRATVFDLPSTLPVTERSIKEAGLEDRIAVMPGNFNTDSLAGSTIWCSYPTCFISGCASHAGLVRKAFTHLTDTGRLVIKDRFLDPDRTSPAWTTAFAVHILVNTEEGQCFTAQEAGRMETRAGFASVTELEPRAIVQGIKSGEA